MLHIAQPPLSVAIRQLEGEWGVSLFERTGRGLVVTDTGHALYERVCELLNHANQIDEDMSALGRGAKGRVRIGFVACGMDAVAGNCKSVDARMRRSSEVLALCEEGGHADGHLSEAEALFIKWLRVAWKMQQEPAPPRSRDALEFAQ